MECLYVPALKSGQDYVEVDDLEELRHVRALRLRQGETVALTNGQGLLVVAELCRIRAHPPAALFRVLGPLPSGELPVPIALALGVVRERERLEFAVEKAVELGVREIVLLRTERTQPVVPRLERLRAKIRAAVKQAHRAWFPLLHGPMTVQECCKDIFPRYPRRLVAQEGGEPLWSHPPVPTLVLVGPEGDWSPQEVQLLQRNGATLWSLGSRRLRSETAAILTLGLVGIALLQPQ